MAETETILREKTTRHPKLLRVNLSTCACREEDIPEETVVDFIGGRGFGVKYLYDELQPGTDPLSPENKLIFSIGPLAATGALSASRWIVTSKSPLTGAYFRGSGGADFGAWMKFAGLDMIVVEGKAEKPVYLYVEDGHYEIKDGRKLWGKDTFKTQEALREIHGSKAASACIGPAGERLVRYAKIMVDRGRCAGRGGMGTVMASKNIKAITINPRAGATAASREFKELISRQVTEYDRFIRSPFSERGTTMGVEGTNALGVFASRNFTEGSIDGWAKMNSDAYLGLKLQSSRCYGCPFHCGREIRVKSGRHSGVTTMGLEFQTIWAFSGTIGSNDIAFPIAADLLCDQMGIDTISAGNSIGFAYELFNRRIITKEDTGGLDLTWGNHEAALELLKKIANREGLGDILAEGVKRASERIGKESAEYAMHIKGLEMPAYEPRAAKWMGLAIATCPCGAFHNLGYSSQELLGSPFPRPVDRFAEKGYADVNKMNEDMTAVIDSGVLCTFVLNVMRLPSLSLLSEMLASATGVRQFTTKDTVLKVGERIVNLERAFNIREGFGRKDDVYPRRFTTEHLKKAAQADKSVIKNFESMLDEYYVVRGWNSSGIPTMEKLKSLGLREIAKHIIR